MISLKPVKVNTGEDECGQIVPKEIVWENNKIYRIKRILYTCCPEDYVVRYTVLIGNSQRYLYYDGKGWTISDAVA